MVCPKTHQKSVETRTLCFNHKRHPNSHTAFIELETLITLRKYFELFQGKYAKVTELKKTEKLICPLPQSKVKPNQTGLSAEARVTKVCKSTMFYKDLTFPKKMFIIISSSNCGLVTPHIVQKAEVRAFLEWGRSVF